jgi:uncharacterized membrane protein YphA (DoxX/SURF4 family)
LPLEHTAADGPLADSNTAHWPASLRAIFRFVYAYVFLYAIYGLTYVYAFLSARFVKGNFVFPIDEALSRFVPWFAAHILRIHQTITYAPSGDASFSWIEHLLFLLVAVLAAVVWSVLDGKRPHYRLADQQLRLLVRLTLASLMFAYGFDKVYPTQFHSVTRTDLVTQFGDLNHFNLMWHFMAASKGYTIFSGLLEVLGGVLLLIPMFTNVGALVTVVVMSNVVALNFAYNIPVKLFSSHILLMALFLVAPLVPRLTRVLILNRDVPPERPARLSSNPKVDRFARIALVSLGAIIFFAFLFEQRAHYAEIRKAEAAPVPLQGIWLVDQFVSSNPQQPLLNATTAQELHVLPGDDRWLRLIFEHRGELAIQGLNGEINYVSMALDKNHTSASLTDPGDDAWKANLTLDQPAPDKLHLKGIVNGAPVEASLHRIDESHFAVKDEGLHLVNR